MFASYPDIEVSTDCASQANWMSAQYDDKFVCWYVTHIWASQAARYEAVEEFLCMTAVSAIQCVATASNFRVVFWRQPVCPTFSNKLPLNRRPEPLKFPYSFSSDISTPSSWSAPPPSPSPVLLSRIIHLMLQFTCDGVGMRIGLNWLSVSCPLH